MSTGGVIRVGEGTHCSRLIEVDWAMVSQVVQEFFFV